MVLLWAPLVFQESTQLTDCRGELQCWPSRTVNQVLGSTRIGLDCLQPPESIIPKLSQSELP